MRRLSRYAALKIYAANVDASMELSIQQQLRAKSERDPDSTFVLLLSDSFTVQGPNGKHLCLVAKPMGPSISAFLNAPFEEYDPLNPPTRRFSTLRKKRILKGILSGLQFLHGNNVVHGDLQLGNVLLPPKDLTTVQPSELEQNQSNAQLDPLVRKDGKVDRWSPKYLVVPEPLEAAESAQDEEVIKLIDFGGGKSPIAVILPSDSLTCLKLSTSAILLLLLSHRLNLEHQRPFHTTDSARPLISGASGVSCSGYSPTIPCFNYLLLVSWGRLSTTIICSRSHKL